MTVCIIYHSIVIMGKIRNVLIGFIQQDCKSVIPRSGATWESPGTASVIATFYQEIAAP